MPTEKTWQEWLERLYNLRRDKRGSHERPHKPVLLLSILGLLDRGQVKANQIALTSELVKTFRRYFDVVRREDVQVSVLTICTYGLGLFALWGAAEAAQACRSSKSED